MARIRHLLILGLTLLAPGLAVGQTEVCRLTESWVHRTPFQASSNELVGTFPLILEDKPIRKLFRHEESGVDVSVGVETFTLMDKSASTQIRIALAFGSKPEELFGAFSDESEARSVYDKHLRILSVGRSILVGDRFYTFTFSCERVPPKSVRIDRRRTTRWSGVPTSRDVRIKPGARVNEIATPGEL